MRWDFHGLIIEATADDATVSDRLAQLFLPWPQRDDPADIVVHFASVDDVPGRPDTETLDQQGDLVSYYRGPSECSVIAHLPWFGQFVMDLEERTTTAQACRAGLANRSIFEDALTLALSPHLKRAGFFPIHAFAAEKNGHGVLIVGDIGSGKTTTGLALLSAGWKLLSNDAPVIRADGTVHSFPGTLAAYPESLRHFDATRHLADHAAPKEPRKKLYVQPESVWPNPWSSSADARLILLPRIDAAGHRVEAVARASALPHLLRHSVEKWDQEIMPAHLGALRGLVEQATTYQCLLGSDVNSLPHFIEDLLN